MRKWACGDDMTDVSAAQLANGGATASDGVAGGPTKLTKGLLGMTMSLLSGRSSARSSARSSGLGSVGSAGQANGPDSIFVDGMPFYLTQARQVEIASGGYRLLLAGPAEPMAEWWSLLQRATSRSYQSCLLFPRDSVVMSTADGKQLRLLVDHISTAEILARDACRILKLSGPPWWQLHEEWSYPGLPGGAFERRVPAREPIIDLLNGREAAERRRHGLVASVRGASDRLTLVLDCA